MPSLFKKIGKAFSEIGKLWKTIAGIQVFLMCPMSLLANLPLCLFCFLGDVLVYIIWYPFFLLSVLLIYIPVKITAASLCAIGRVPLLANLCFKVPFEDYTLPKNVVSVALEIMYNVFGIANIIPLAPKYLLYRNGSDLKKCYCIPGLKYVFQPLTKKVDNDITGAKYFAANPVLAYLFGAITLIVIGCLTLMYPKTDTGAVLLEAKEKGSGNLMDGEFLQKKGDQFETNGIK